VFALHREAVEAEKIREEFAELGAPIPGEAFHEERGDV
jgi:hypothetical protein